MAFLVDANVVSEVSKPEPHEGVVKWLLENEMELVVDPHILGEIEAGILYLPKSKKRQRLEVWFADVVKAIHCLEWNIEVGSRWAGLLAELRSSGKSMPVVDSLIAATALTHRLTVATRNVSDFRKAGVDVINPFEL